MKPPLVGVVLVAALVAAGCVSGGSQATPPSTKDPLQGSVTVSAASSLGSALAPIRQGFVKLHPRASVSINLGSSTALVTQIQQGAPADVFVSADPTNMQTLVAAGKTAGTPAVIARNRLVIVTKPKNPRHIRSVAGLSSAGVVALCAATAPCGKYAARVLVNAHATLPETKITRQADAQSTVGAVANGDADAAIVYATDARAAGAAVATVEIPSAENVVATYPIAALKESGVPAVARAFVAYVQSSAGQVVLRRFGFLPPA